MARPARTDFAGAFHHVINRGTAQTALYRSDADRRTFITLLSELDGRFGVELHALALMTNHYHLVVRSASGRLSEALQWLNGRYAAGFNHRHDRTGALFQGRFSSRAVDTESYLEALVHYVHLNPVDAGLVDDATSYRWSSMPSYAGLRSTPRWLHTDVVLAGRRPAAFVADLLRSRPGLPPGTDAHLEPADPTTEPEVFVEVEARVARHFGVTVDEIHRLGTGAPNLARQAAIAVTSAADDVTEQAVAARYGLRDGSAVRQARRRFNRLAEQDQLLAEFLHAS